MLLSIMYPIYISTPDKSLDLDNLLVQLQNVPSSKWYQLGECLGVPAESLNKITNSFPSAPDQCKIEMLDFWLRNRTSEGQATWREVAEALTRIQEHKLANELTGVYTTGEYAQLLVKGKYSVLLDGVFTHSWFTHSWSTLHGYQTGFSLVDLHVQFPALCFPPWRLIKEGCKWEASVL